MISTPDHWHVPIAVAALKAGKDVSLEKPITRLHSRRPPPRRPRGPAQACLPRRQRVPIARAVPPRGRARAQRAHRQGAHHPQRVARRVVPRRARAPRRGPPAELDYDLWLGPAPQVPYIQKRVHPSRDLKGRPGWMRSTLFCDGMLTNWGAHLNDIAQWGNGTERTGPVEVKATGKFHEGKVWDVLESFDAWYRFANGVEMFYEMGEPHVRFEGDKGWIQVNYFKTRTSIPSSRPATRRSSGRKIGPGELRLPAAERARRLHRGREDPRPDDGGRGGRPTHDLALPPRVRLDPARRREAEVGSGQGAVPRRSRRQQAAERARAAAPWGTE